MDHRRLWWVTSLQCNAIFAQRGSHDECVTNLRQNRNPLFSIASVFQATQTRHVFMARRTVGCGWSCVHGALGVIITVWGMFTKWVNGAQLFISPMTKQKKKATIIYSRFQFLVLWPTWLRCTVCHHYLQLTKASFLKTQFCHAGKTIFTLTRFSWQQQRHLPCIT